jgi:hypothetical protein
VWTEPIAVLLSSSSSLLLLLLFMGTSNKKRSAKRHRTHTTLNWQNRWTQALNRQWKQRITSLRF